VQVTGLPPTQRPSWQLSARVQAFPSSQVAPSALVGFEQAPDVGSQVPGAWHWSDAAQLMVSPPTHVPAWQASVRVHAFPSLHLVPSALAGFEQTPLVGLHVPASWHWSEAVHVTRLPPTHAPAWQASVRVHALPSSHVVPLALAGLEHAPDVGSHVPASWH
jgi:hypothetical protein